MNFQLRKRLPSSRHILKRVAFEALRQGFHTQDIAWERMIQSCAEAYAETPQQYQLMVERAMAALDRAGDELWRTSPGGSKPNDLDFCYYFLLEQ